MWGHVKYSQYIKYCYSLKNPSMVERSHFFHNFVPNYKFLVFNGKDWLGKGNLKNVIEDWLKLIISSTCGSNLLQFRRLELKK